MNDERADRRRNCPDGEIGWLDVDAVLIEESLDQKNRADRDEDVFAEEKRDVVDSRRVGADETPRPDRQLTVTGFGSAFGHRRDQRPHHLRVSTERSEPEGGGDLSEAEVDEQHSRCGRRPNATDYR